MASVTAIGGLGPYTVAKHGVLGLSDVLRAELTAAASPVGVSVVFPGRIRSGMNPIGTVEPSTVALNVMDAVRRNRPYVFTDDHATNDVRDRFQAIIAARADVLAPPPGSDRERRPPADRGLILAGPAARWTLSSNSEPRVSPRSRPTFGTISNP